MFKKSNHRSDSKNEFWIGFSDLMTGLMLVFIILSLTFMAISQQKIDRSAQEVVKIEKILEEQKDLKTKLVICKQELNQSVKKVAQMEKILAELEELKKKLEEQRKNIIVILAQQLGSFDIKVEYNELKGTVTVAQDILFEQSQIDLSSQGKDFIQLFSKVLDGSILGSSDYEKLIKYIHIEGYASREGSESQNLILSFQRAQNVWNSMVTSDIKHVQSMRHKLNIVSRGEIDADQDIINPSDRKVVFRFEFYDNYNELFKGLSQ